MENSSRIEQLLEEIRDLVRESLADSREQAAASMRLAEESVARQRAMGSYYRKVVVASAIVVFALLALLYWWIM